MRSSRNLDGELKQLSDQARNIYLTGKSSVDQFDFQKYDIIKFNGFERLVRPQD
jgi:hypothetical protein